MLNLRVTIQKAGQLVGVWCCLLGWKKHGRLERHWSAPAFVDRSWEGGARVLVWYGSPLVRNRVAGQLVVRTYSPLIVIHDGVSGDGVDSGIAGGWIVGEGGSIDDDHSEPSCELADGGLAHGLGWAGWVAKLVCIVVELDESEVGGVMRSDAAVISSS